jgi:hypothetical protein
MNSVLRTVNLRILSLECTITLPLIEIDRVYELQEL